MKIVVILAMVTMGAAAVAAEEGVVPAETIAIEVKVAVDPAWVASADGDGGLALAGTFLEAWPQPELWKSKKARHVTFHGKAGDPIWRLRQDVGSGTGELTFKRRVAWDGTFQAIARAAQELSGWPAAQGPALEKPEAKAQVEWGAEPGISLSRQGRMSMAAAVDLRAAFAGLANAKASEGPDATECGGFLARKWSWKGDRDIDLEVWTAEDGARIAELSFKTESFVDAAAGRAWLLDLAKGRIATDGSKTGWAREHCAREP